MCEISKVQRRIFRDQDPPRIREKAKDNRFLKNESEFSKSTPNSPTALQQRASTASLEKCLSEPGFLEKELKNENCSRIKTKELASFSSTTSLSLKVNADEKRKESSSFVSTNVQDFIVELSTKVPSSSSSSPSFSFCDKKVIANGLKNDSSDSCDVLTNGRKMAPVLGVPPPPPPAPHMGPDGLILPRKPYNPCLTSTNHKDLRRELLFNQKIGRNVLNQKSELQRALEKQRENASRKEAERIREETFKDDPRTALQRAIEQRAKHIQIMQEQSQPTMIEPPNNLLITARAKLRPRTDSQ